MLAFTARRLITPAETIEDPLLLVDGGKIVDAIDRKSQASPTRATILDFGESMIAPGYIDLHIHGSAGFDVMDQADDALPKIERLLGKHGVTSYYPTTVTAPMDTICRALERLSKAIDARTDHDP